MTSLTEHLTRIEKRINELSTAITTEALEASEKNKGSEKYLWMIFDELEEIRADVKDLI